MLTGCVLALHEQAVGKSDEWYTPPYIFEALGIRFHMDVASPGSAVVPWIPAAVHLTSSSLGLPWRGLVWMNPPFGGRNGLVPWLRKFVTHAGGGICLVPDRTSAPWWQEFAPEFDAILFVAPKIKFIPGPGAKASSPAQGTCLCALGSIAARALRHAGPRLGRVMVPA